MPRRRRPEPREVIPDPLYSSTLVEKFVNSMMWDGKKATAQKIFYQAMDVLRGRSGDDPVKAFKKAVENVKPHIEVRSRRVNGSCMRCGPASNDDDVLGHAGCVPAFFRRGQWSYAAVL